MPIVQQEIFGDVTSTTDWIIGGNGYYLPGVNPDLSVRFTAEELVIVIGEIAKIVGEPETCVAGAVLGGALEKSDLHFWENDSLTAQAVCKTEVTYDAVRQVLMQKDPDFAKWLEIKRKAVKDATLASYQEQANQDRAKVIKTAADTATAAAKKAGDIASAAATGLENTFDALPILIGVVLVAVVVVSAVVISRK